MIPTKLAILQGAVRINLAHVIARGPGCVLVEVDLNSKHAEIHAGMSGPVPSVWLMPVADSTELDSEHEGAVTIAEFVEFPGWVVFSCDCSRYTCRVALKEEP